MIRSYRSEDLQDIVAIGNKAWQGIYQMFNELYGDELFNLTTPDHAVSKGKQIESHCQAHPDWIYICEENDKIVGFVTFFLDNEKKIGEIGNNAVDVECGLKGIGQQMYKAVLDHFHEKGMLYAKVSTGLDEGHSRARRAYERAGFNIKQENITYYKKL